MRRRVLTGTILGLVLFALGAVATDWAFEQQADRYQALIDLFFPLEEKVSEMHLLLLQHQAIEEQIGSVQGDSLPELRRVSRGFSDALSAGFAAAFALLAPTEGISPEAHQGLRDALEPIERDFSDHSAAIDHVFDRLQQLQPEERGGLEADLAALARQRNALQDSMARFEELLDHYHRQALAVAAGGRSSIRRLFLAVALLAVFLGALANVYFYRSLLPLKSMVEAVREVKRGHYSVRVPFDGGSGDEVGFLAGEINAMAEALGEQRAAIERGQEFIRATFDGIQDVLIVHDESDRVLNANPAAHTLARHLGHSELSCFRHLLGLDGACPAIAAGARGEPRSTQQIVTHPRSGNTFEVSCQPVLGPEGDVRFVIEFVRDITEKLQLERQVRQGEKLSAIGELSLGVAHEVRNPLSTIQMTLHALRKRHNLSQVESERLSLALHEVDRLDGLVSSLLEYGRPSRPKVAPVALRELIERCIGLVEAESTRCGVEVVVDETSPDLPDVEADANQVIEVLVNLLLNAIQASEPGSTVGIAATTRRSGGAADEVEIVIADEGSGIDPEELKRVFTPFFTTRRDGTGLGLPVARKIAEAHGGTLTLDSVRGRGTRAVLTLPLRSIAADSVAEAEV